MGSCPLLTLGNGICDLTPYVLEGVLGWGRDAGKGLRYEKQSINISLDLEHQIGLKYWTFSRYQTALMNSTYAFQYSGVAFKEFDAKEKSLQKV